MAGTTRWPQAPLVVICCDGSEPDYMEMAMAEGLMPNLKKMIAKGENTRGLCVIPSFTNPNNLSIVTGAPPAVHGICGNYLIDPVTGLETMMNDPKWLRAPTIFEKFQKAGAKIAVVTAKDKLRLLLGKGLVFDGTAVAFSSEHADKATLKDNGIEGVCEMVGMAVPEVYSAELSEFVFAAGVKLLASMKPDLMYLSTTDYVQHKYAPGSKGANSFYKMMDGYLGQLDAQGRHRRDRGRSRHEGQAFGQWRTRCDLSAGCPGQELWRRNDQGHPAHHRSLCAASRRAGFICNGLCQRDLRSRTSRRSLQSSPALMWFLTGRRAAHALNCRKTAWATSSSCRAGSTGSKVIGTSRAQA